MHGLSLHNYTVVTWPPLSASAGFGEAEYTPILESTLKMDDLIKQHAAIMSAKVEADQVSLTLESKSVRVVAIRP
jgi:alpha-L-arabinofuranosidase